MNQLKHLFCCLLAVVLCSCGVQIQMDTMSPSAAGLGRGNPLMVSDYTGNHASRMLESAFRNRIIYDGFFRLSSSYGINIELCNVHVENEPHHHHHHDNKDKDHTQPLPTLCATVYIRSGGRTVYQRSFRETVYLRDNDRMKLREACEEIAEEAMDDLTPHPVRYSRYITPDDNIPELEQAANACARRNWQLGRQLTSALLSRYPHCAEAHYLMGLIERNDGNYPASDACFSTAHQLKPDSKYSNGLHDNVRMQQDEAAAAAQMQ